MRKLVTIEKIENIQPIDGADSIEKIQVRGWWVVAQKSIGYKVGDLVVYHELDSFLPDNIDAYKFLVEKSPKNYDGRVGHVLRSIKLRGQISQGFCVPFFELFDIHLSGYESKVTVTQNNTKQSLTLMRNNDLEFSPTELIGLEVTELLGVVKYEPPVPASLSGLIKGNFPSWSPKTDQERAQNMRREIEDAFNSGELFEVTIKLDGSSMSVGVSPEGELVVCSRNLALKLDQEGNTFVDVAKTLPTDQIQPGYMIQGELMGEGIQGNQEKLKGHEFFVFDVWNSKESRYLNAQERSELCSQLGLKHVPVLSDSTTLENFLKNITGDSVVDRLLKAAEGGSLNINVKREGIVFKSLERNFSFKAISNTWLLKNGG